MAVLTVAGLRQRVAAAIEAVTTPVAMTQAAAIYDLFPEAQTPQASMSAGAFAVGVGRTVADSALESRRTAAEAGASVKTPVGVKWLYPLRGDAQVTAYDEALAMEAAIIVAVLGGSQANLPMLSLVDAERTVIADGSWMLGKISFDTRHSIANR